MSRFQRWRLGAAVLVVVAVGVVLVTVAPWERSWMLEGRVVDASGQGVADALLTAAGGQTVRADATGRFALESSEPGTWVTATRAGYLSRTRT